MDLGWDQGARVAVAGLGFLPPPVTHLLRNMTEVASNFGRHLSHDSSRVANITIFVEGNGPLLVERTSEYYREISLPPLPVDVKLQSVGKCTVHTTQCGSAAAAWSMMGLSWWKINFHPILNILFHI